MWASLDLNLDSTVVVVVVVVVVAVVVGVEGFSGRVEDWPDVFPEGRAAAPRRACSARPCSER